MHRAEILHTSVQCCLKKGFFLRIRKGIFRPGNAWDYLGLGIRPSPFLYSSQKKSTKDDFFTVDCRSMVDLLYMQTQRKGVSKHRPSTSIDDVNLYFVKAVWTVSTSINVD